jgi:2-succinyl-6-hydroxy-2,4-cyclohexadiene-1-carboxylate synthase
LFCEILRKGSGVPIVLLHGFLGRGSDWRKMVSHLHGRTCIAFDLPGHGKTTWSEIKIEDQLSCSLPLEPIDLVGYSLGGRLAMRFALSHPARIHSLTLLSTNYGLSCDADKTARLQTDQIWAQKILSLPWDEFIFHWYNQPIFSSLGQNKQALNEILSARTLQKPSEPIKALLTWSLGYQNCYRDQLLTFSRPIQIAYGEKDEKLAELYSNWPTARCIAGAGHTLHFESPKEISRFLMPLPFTKAANFTIRHES